MQSGFTVIFDACVLYPAPVRDILIQLAAKGLFRGRWTKRIQDEWVRNLLLKKPELKESQLHRTCLMMNEAVLDCLVVGYEELLSDIFLPDPDDVHVLAAAIKTFDS